MQFVILGLLLTGPLSLYDVQKYFRSGIALFYSASSGSIERALRALVDAGSVSVAEADGDRRRRKLHSVTPEGRERWRAWMLAPVSEGTGAETEVLAKVFLLGRLDSARDRESVLDAAQAQARSGLAQLRALDAQLEELTGHLPEEQRQILAYQRATLAYGIRSQEVMYRWLDDVRQIRP